MSLFVKFLKIFLLEKIKLAQDSIKQPCLASKFSFGLFPAALDPHAVAQLSFTEQLGLDIQKQLETNQTDEEIRKQLIKLIKLKTEEITQISIKYGYKDTELEKAIEANVKLIKSFYKTLKEVNLVDIIYESEDLATVFCYHASKYLMSKIAQPSGYWIESVKLEEEKKVLMKELIKSCQDFGPCWKDYPERKKDDLIRLTERGQKKNSELCVTYCRSPGLFETTMLNAAEEINNWVLSYPRILASSMQPL